MASNTSNLNLLKKDPLTDGKDTFNIRTMLNENWDKIDEAHGQTNARIDSLKTALDNVGNLHVWEKCLYSYSVENSQNKTRVSLTTNTDYQYSSSVKGGPNGTELVEPQTFTTPSTYGDISTLSNKYILNPSDGKIYLWTSNNSNSSGWYYDCYEIITVRTLEHTDYLTSTDRNAYPDNVTDAQDAYYTLGDESQNVMIAGENYQSYASCALFYSDSVSVNDIGDVSLNNPSSAVYKMSEWPSNFGILAGKFVRDQDNPSTIYYLPADVSIINNSGLVATKSQRVTGHAAIPANTTITYLGQLGGGARIEVGSYVGTGTTSGVTLTFESKPKIVIVKMTTYSYTLICMYEHTYGFTSQGTSSSVQVTTTWGYKSLTFKNSANSSTAFNDSGKIYEYIAIG